LQRQRKSRKIAAGFNDHLNILLIGGKKFQSSMKQKNFDLIKDWTKK
jgi:hypothetical protein